MLSKRYQTRRRRRGWHENLTKTFFVEYRDYNTEGKDTRHVNFVVMMAAVLAVLLAAGCTSAPVKETSTTNVSVTESQATPNSSVTVTETQAKDRFVQINLLDGTSVGGKYVSETAAFTTIDVMYTINPEAKKTIGTIYAKDPDNYIIKGNGAEVGIKNALINTVVTIEKPNPDQMIEDVQQEVKDEVDAADKARNETLENAKKAQAERDAKNAKYMPTKKA